MYLTGYFKSQYNWFPCYSSFYWICLYMKTASKDYLIFKKQAILIIRRIKVSIKDKSILCTKQCKHEMNTKTISEIYNYIPVNHKCLHLYQIEIHFNTHQHAQMYIFHCFSSNKCNSWSITFTYTNIEFSSTVRNWIKEIYLS